MAIRSISRYIRRVQRQTGSAITYMRLAFEGNKVERRTDFSALKRPVLLLHGYAGTRRVMRILENRLREDGFSVFSLNLGGIFETFNTKPIPELAKLVAQKIEGLYRRYGIREKLSVIGHSKGGLIGRCYIKDFDGHKRVKTLITLGTPHQGNPWAMVGLFTPLALFTESIRQMTPVSPFIRRMRKTPWPKPVKIVSIFSKVDSMCPYPSAMLDTGGAINVKNVELKDVSHSEFLLKKRVYWIIRRELLEEMSAAKRLPPLRKKQKGRSGSKSKEPARLAQ